MVSRELCSIFIRKDVNPQKQGTNPICESNLQKSSKTLVFFFCIRDYNTMLLLKCFLLQMVFFLNCVLLLYTFLLCFQPFFLHACVLLPVFVYWAPDWPIWRPWLIYTLITDATNEVRALHSENGALISAPLGINAATTRNDAFPIF